MIVRPIKRGWGERRGTAAMEFAAVLPFLFFLIAGLWEVGRMTEIKQVLDNAAREGARQAATGNENLTAVQTAVTQYITSAEPGVTNTSGMQILYSDITNSSVTDPTGASQLDRFTITITIPYSNISWSILSQITSATQLTSTVDFYCLRDTPVVVTTSMPTQ